MKKVFNILSLAVFSIIMMTACNNSKSSSNNSTRLGRVSHFFTNLFNNEEDKIIDVATNYLRAINFDCDFEKAKEYATPETHDLLNLLSQFWSMSMDSIDSDFRDMYINSTVDITSVEIFDDSTANVQYLLTVIDKDGNVDKDALGEEGGIGELMLKKINNQWLAHQSKEDSQSDEFIDEEFEETEETDSI